MLKMSEKITKTSERKKGKKTPRAHKFSFIDFLLILLCLIIILGCVFVFSPNFQFDILDRRKDIVIQYTVEIQGVDEEFIRNIKEDDSVIDSVTKNSLGTVIAVDYSTKHSVLGYTDVNGSKEGILVEYPDKYNVVVTVSAPAKYKSGEGYTVNNCRIAVGELLALKFPNYVCECYCIGIEDL